jgi:16S rRNA (uracil1498-N3)-methyltransferase
MKRFGGTEREPRSGARFHVPGPLSPGAETLLPPDTAHHAIRVLRLAVDDAVTLFDGYGGEYLGRVVAVARGQVRVLAGTHRAVERESPVRVTLVQGISSSERMDYTVRKCVELGIARVVPVFTRRSVVKLGSERSARRRQHWQQLCVAACEQCGRNQIPPVDEPVDFDHWLSGLGAAGADEPRLALAASANLALKTLAAPAAAMLLVGPEGGLDQTELAMARSRGFQDVRLGPRILRTETAAVAALAAIQALWGDF